MKAWPVIQRACFLVAVVGCADNAGVSPRGLPLPDDSQEQCASVCASLLGSGVPCLRAECRDSGCAVVLLPDGTTCTDGQGGHKAGQCGSGKCILPRGEAWPERDSAR